MFVLGQKVNRVGQTYPTGIIELFTDDGLSAIVLWGISDNVRHTETIKLSELECKL